MSLADLTLRGFSRRQEAAADRFGLRILHREYGHVADAGRFFERIAEGSGNYADMIGYLSTHPPPKDRVVAMIRYAGQQGWSIRGDVTPIAW